MPDWFTLSTLGIKNTNTDNNGQHKPTLIKRLKQLTPLNQYFHRPQATSIKTFIADFAGFAFPHFYNVARNNCSHAIRHTSALIWIPLHQTWIVFAAKNCVLSWSTARNSLRLFSRHKRKLEKIKTAIGTSFEDARDYAGAVKGDNDKEIDCMFNRSAPTLVSSLVTITNTTKDLIFWKYFISAFQLCAQVQKNTEIVCVDRLRERRIFSSNRVVGEWGRLIEWLRQCKGRQGKWLQFTRIGKSGWLSVSVNIGVDLNGFWIDLQFSLWNFFNLFFFTLQAEMILRNPFVSRPHGKPAISRTTSSTLKAWPWSEHEWNAIHHRTDSRWYFSFWCFMASVRWPLGTCSSRLRIISSTTNCPPTTPEPTTRCSTTKTFWLTLDSPHKFPTCCSTGWTFLSISGKTNDHQLAGMS